MNRSEAELMAANLHAKGDTFYHAEMYTTAYVQFTNSIQFLKRCSSNSKENLKILFAKRSLTCLKMGNYKKCLEDAQCALKLLEDGDDSLNELIRIRKVIIENVLKTDLLVSQKLLILMQIITNFTSFYSSHQFQKTRKSSICQLMLIHRPCLSSTRI